MANLRPYKASICEINCINLTFEGIKGGFEIGNYAHAPPQERYSKLASGILQIIGFAHACRIVCIKQDRQPAETGDDFAENFKPLACNFGLLNRHSSHVAAWMREVINQPGRYWVNRQYKNNRN